MNAEHDINTELAEARTSLAQERTYLAKDRTRLASERTYLSWLRTGLASVGGGIAIIRLLSFRSEEHQLTAQMMGVLLVLIGISMFILSSVDYLKCYPRFESDPKRGCSTRMTAAIGLTFALISTILIYMIAQPTHTH
jgi:putative membrane protein